jgi:rubrerythrin
MTNPVAWSITDVADLRRHLQWAVEIEHSTIPPYEYALWSVVDAESPAATSIKYVVREEMLHTALAANLLTAVGGTPRFTGSAAPRYPEPMRLTTRRTRWSSTWRRRPWI